MVDILTFLEGPGTLNPRSPHTLSDIAVFGIVQEYLGDGRWRDATDSQYASIRRSLRRLVEDGLVRTWRESLRIGERHGTRLPIVVTESLWQITPQGSEYLYRLWARTTTATSRTKA
jgi:hypothetical protein